MATPFLVCYLVVVSIFLPAAAKSASAAAAATSSSGDDIDPFRNNVHAHRTQYDDVEPCDDDSFPLAPASALRDGEGRRDGRQRPLLVPVPDDPDRRTYAPLCGGTPSVAEDDDDRDDGRRRGGPVLRINVRRLKSCDAGQCFVPAYQQCFHSTSFECNHDIPLSSSAPTPRPSHPTVDSVHAVKLMLKNVPGNYRPSAEVRSTILRFVTEMLQETLGDVGLELIGVEFAGRLKKFNNDNKNDGRARHLRRAQQHHRRLDSVAIPLRVTVRGPADVSDFALSYIMEFMRSRFGDLIAYLKKNGGKLQGNYGNGGGGGGQSMANVFANVDLGADTYDFDDLLVGLATDSPTGSPTIRSPPPTAVKAVEKDKIAVLDAVETVDASLPWWAWLIIVLVVLLCLLCSCCYCVRRRRSRADKLETKQEQAINIWMKRPSGAGEEDDDSSHGVKSKKTGVVDRGHRPRRVHKGPPRSIGVQENGNDGQRSRRPRPRRPSIGTVRNGNKSRRPSRRPSPARQPHYSVKRKVSQTELEEEERERTFNDDGVSTQASDAEAGRIVPFDGDDPDIVSTAVSSVDPPEENALVPYSHRRHFEETRSHATEEPYGSKAPKNASMYASEAYYGGGGGIDDSNRSQDPDGAKIPKQTSMFASQAIQTYHSSPVVSHGSAKTRRHRREPGGVKTPKKDSMFVCPIDELPEDVRSRRDGAEAGSGVRGEGGVRRKKKKKSSATSKKKKKRSAAALDSLRSSLTRTGRSHPTEDDTPLDIFVDNDEGEGHSMSMITMQKDLKLVDDMEPADDGNDSAIQALELIKGGCQGQDNNGECDSEERQKKKKEEDSATTRSRGSKRPGQNKRGIYSSLTRRLSWKGDGNGGGGEGASYASEDSLGLRTVPRGEGESYLGTVVHDSPSLRTVPRDELPDEEEGGSASDVRRPQNNGHQGHGGSGNSGDNEPSKSKKKNKKRKKVKKERFSSFTRRLSSNNDAVNSDDESIGDPFDDSIL